MNDSQIKKVENLNNNWITYFAKSTFTYDTAMEIIHDLQNDKEVKTFSVYALLFFGYSHTVIEKENIDKVNEYLKVFTEYKLNLVEIKYSNILKEITILFE